jgi:acyl carrier protein
MDDTMKEKILSILSDMRPDIEFETEEGLISDGLLESFDLIQLIATLENEFGVEIGNKNITKENFDSLDRIVSLIESLLK